MNTIITTVSLESKDGGGWASRKLFDNGVFEIRARGNSTFTKILYAVFGILLFPWLHPVFTRYLLPSILLCNRKVVYLNFSQTFVNVFFIKNATMVCHDLQVHKNHYFKKWAIFSEILLLKKASRVYCLSRRDYKIVKNCYRIPPTKIVNVFNIIVEPLSGFNSIIPIVKHVYFIGSMSRAENRTGIVWFVENVLVKTPNVILHIIGSVPDDFAMDNPRVNLEGFVDDPSFIINKCQLMIAPMFSSAGIKIKVVEALQQKMPVLGTPYAFTGLNKPRAPFVSIHPADWIDVLNSSSLTYSYHV